MRVFSNRSFNADFSEPNDLPLSSISTKIYRYFNDIDDYRVKINIIVNNTSS